MKAIQIILVIVILIVVGYCFESIHSRLTKVEKELNINSELTIQNSDYITTDARRAIEWQNCYEGGGTKVGRIVHWDLNWVVYTPPENIERVLRQLLHRRWQTKDSLRYSYSLLRSPDVVIDTYAAFDPDSIVKEVFEIMDSLGLLPAPEELREDSLALFKSKKKERKK